MRAVALVRVVLWHAFSAAFLTYLVAAMPAMFFVTGHLYANSADRHGAWTTVRDRLRRILPPLWLFGAVAWLIMAIGAANSGTGLRPWRVLAWLLPVVDPRGSEWEAGWLATPLWYLRAMLWLLALAPLLIRFVRRWPVATFTIGFVAVLALDRADRSPAWHPDAAPMAVWWVGDLFLYGLFFLAGVRARDGARVPVPPRQLLIMAAVASAAAVAWRLTQPVPLGVVNNSHPMHLFVGTAWLALVLAVRQPLAALAARRPLAGLVRTLGQRSLTIYLWHTTAIAAVLWLVDRAGPRPEPLDTAMYVVMVVVGVTVAVLAVGWAEDLAARRPARWLPALPASPRRPRRWAAVMVPAVLAVVVVAYVAQPTDQESAASTFRPAVPSQAPPRPRFEPVPEGDDRPAPATHTAVLDGPALDRALSRWADDQNVRGVAAGVAVGAGERTWLGAHGEDADGNGRDPGAPVALQSITKVFTANLVYRAVEDGLIDLDAPLPSLEEAPDFPYTSRVTPRQLLAHRSGLANYRDTDTFTLDPRSIDSPEAALDAVAVTPMTAPPGTTTAYSSTNYLLLGYLLEQVTGRSFEELLGEEILGPLGLDSTVHRRPGPGEPRFTTAGLVSPLDEVLVATTGLVRDHAGISERSYRDMATIDRASALGPGLIGYCPCTLDAEGRPEWFAIGAAGGSTLTAYLPDYDVVVAVDVTGGLYEPNRIAPALGLMRALADEVRATPPR